MRPSASRLEYAQRNLVLGEIKMASLPSGTQTKNRGVFSIPVTPFNEDGSVDYGSLRSCVSYCVEAGAHGVVMPVNASEGPRLTDEERDEVLRVGVATVNGAVPVVAGASGISIEHCIERARVAVECGADSIMAMPVNGMGGGQETIDLIRRSQRSDRSADLASKQQTADWTDDSYSDSHPDYRRDTGCQPTQRRELVAGQCHDRGAGGVR